MAAWRCSICLLFLCLTLRELLNHIHVSHAGSPNFQVACMVDGCPRIYRRYHSFYKHVITIHRDTYEAAAGRGDGQEIPAAGTQVVERIDEIATDENPEAVEENNREEGTARANLKHEASRFLLDLRTRHKLSKTSLNNISTGAERLVTLSLENYKASLVKSSKDSLNREDSQRLQQMIASSDFENPFQGLETSFLQDKYIRDTMSNVEPKEVKLGETLKMKIVRNKRRFVVENECFMYVPLTDSLQVFLENSRIREMVLSNSKTAPPGYFYDFFDGSVVTNHHLSGGDLGLIIYFDEIELCNPLGSKTGRHKMSMFYYSVLNIDVKFRSKLEAIRLLAVVESHVMKKYGIDKILEPFVNDMIRMSNGVDFTFDDGERNIRAYLIAAVGDTPASNCLGGFKESVGAAFIKCRECMCTLQQMKVCFDSNNFTTRHMELHEQQCHQIESADTEYMRNHLSTTFGISRRSSLINVPHFNVCNMMPQDLMHVVLEGVAQYEIKEVIKLFLKEKSFSLTQFNTMLKTFHYPYFDIKSKPSVLLPTTLTSDDNRLRQSASQMLVFIKVLPFIMHSFTERENVYLQFIAELMTIVNILLSPIISIGSVITLKHLIKVHLEKFTRLFPYCSIIPKQHYMCHWPETIMRFGPPVRFSCMRFEGKHKVFKNMAKNQNFINLKKSLTEDYLKSECISKDVESEEDHPIFSSEKIIGTTKQCENIQRESEVISSFYPGIQNIRNVHFCSNIVLNGTKYIPNQCVLVVSCTDLQPIFGLLKKISIVTSDDDQNIVFYFEEFETLHFDNQMQAYVIDVPTLAQGYVLKKPSDCLDYSCYSIVHYENKTFVPIRNDLTSLIELNNDGATNLFS